MSWSDVVAKLDGWKTVLGLVITAGAQVCAALGHPLGNVDDLVNGVNVAFTSVLSAVGIILATYGRFAANGPVGGVKQ